MTKSSSTLETIPIEKLKPTPNKSTQQQEQQPTELPSEEPNTVEVHVDSNDTETQNSANSNQENYVQQSNQTLEGAFSDDSVRTAQLVNQEESTRDMIGTTTATTSTTEMTDEQVEQNMKIRSKANKGSYFRQFSLFISRSKNLTTFTTKIKF